MLRDHRPTFNVLQDVKKLCEAIKYSCYNGFTLQKYRDVGFVLNYKNIYTPSLFIFTIFISIQYYEYMNEIRTIASDHIYGL